MTLPFKNWTSWSYSYDRVEGELGSGSWGEKGYLGEEGWLGEEG